MGDANKDLELKGLQTYIDGKMKRYSLLFAVNGGAFAIAKLPKDNGAEPIPLPYLSIGAILFTLVMVVDIWLWAHMMKKNFIKDLGFNLPGKTILFFLGLLPIAAWSYVGYQSYWIYIVLTVGVIGFIAGLIAIAVEGKKAEAVHPKSHH